MTDGIQQKFALIINGDPQEERHFANVDRAIQSLRAEDPRYQIGVASPRKPSFPVNVYLPPNEANLSTLISGLKEKIDEDDLLVVYVTGHGGQGNTGEGCAALPDGCLSNKILADRLKQLAYGKRFIAMDDCYSGGAVSLFTDDKTIVVTAGSPGEQVSCEKFSPYLWDENAPDLDGDHVVTIAERYRYAVQKGQSLTFSNYFSTIRSFSLSGKNAATSSFPPDIVTVESAEQLKKELEGLGPDQLALVMFSAAWCGPCKEYLPTFERLAQEYGGQFRMIHANRPVEDERSWPEFGIRELPTLAFMDSRNGRLVVPPEMRDRPKKFLQMIPVLDLSEEVKVEALRKLPEAKKFLSELDKLMKDSSVGGMTKILQLIVNASDNMKPLLFSYLLPLLQDPSPTLRANSVFALGLLHPYEGPPFKALMAMKTDPDPRVRVEAINAIFSIAPPGLAAFPPDTAQYLNSEISKLKKSPNALIRGRAIAAEILRVPMGPDYHTRLASIYLEALEDPTLEIRHDGVLGVLMEIQEERFEQEYHKKEVIPLEKYPEMEKIVQKMKVDPQLTEALKAAAVQVTNPYLNEALVVALYKAKASAEDVAADWREKKAGTKPEYLDFITSLWDVWYARNKIGSYLGLATGNSIQGKPALNFQPGVETFFGYRWNRFLETRINGSLNWVQSSSSDEKSDQRAALSGGLVLHLAHPFGNTGIDPFLSLQAGYFRFLQEDHSGIGLAVGPGLQIPISNQVLLETAIQGSLDIPFTGSVQPGLRVPVSLVYHF